MTKDKIYKIDPWSFELAIGLIGSEWHFYIYEHTCGCRVLRSFCLMKKENHKQIADLIGMSWEYYEMCLEQEYHPNLLIANVNYWLNDTDVLRLFDSICVAGDESYIKFNLKGKI